MWKISGKEEKKEFLDKAIAFTGDSKLYGYWMREVLKSWPITCEQHLKDKNINRKAFIGHAAVSLAINCPEDITRMAWGMLTESQRESANLEAQNAIEMYEKQNR